MARFIGIRHRRKQTREGEARPTMVAILVGGGPVQSYKLEDDTAELDFLMHRFPVDWRAVADQEEVTWFDKDKAPHSIRPHHCKWREAKRDDDLSHLHPSHVRAVLKKKLPVTLVLVKIPTVFDGLRNNDTVGMMLGGSGDRYAAALSKRGEEIVSRTFRIPPFVFAEYRGEKDKDEDHATLAECVKEHFGLFYLMRRRDREGIRIKEALAMRQDAMKNRIACEQRLLQALVGRTFLNEEGRFPEGVIEDQFDQEKANDQIFQGLQAEEERREKDLAKTVKAAGIWAAIFEPIKGCGPRVAAGLIAPISDIRRFWVEPDAAQMAELKQRCNKLERDGKFREDLKEVAGRITPDMLHFQQVQIVRSWKRANGKENEAKLLDEAIEIHHKRSQLRKQAHAKGQAKLRKFCGVHVNNPDANGEEVPKHLQFPRRRVGQVANWNPIARQTLYLLIDQFNRRPDSEWGKMLLHYKGVFRQRHPDVIEEKVQTKKGGKTVTETKKRYTNGHIHKMAGWRTATKFVDKLFDTWTRLEKDQQRTDKPSVPMSPSNPPEQTSGDQDGEASNPEARATSAA